MVCVKKKGPTETKRKYLDSVERCGWSSGSTLMTKGVVKFKNIGVPDER